MELLDTNRQFRFALVESSVKSISQVYSRFSADGILKTNELEDFYSNQQYAQLMENLDDMDFTNEVPPQVTEIIDVNLEELISNLE
jgi:hypothetical protein